MSSWANIRAAIKTKLEGVAGVENVIDYTFLTSDWKEYLNTTAAEGRIDAFFIHWLPSPEDSVSSGIITRTYSVGIEYIYSVKGESSKTFEENIDAVLSEFNKNTNISVSGASRGYMRVQEKGSAAILKRTPCHRALLVFDVSLAIEVSACG